MTPGRRGAQWPAARTFALFLSASAAAGARADEPVLVTFSNLPPVRSIVTHERRFLVTGTDTLQLATASRYTAELATRVEQVLGAGLPYGRDATLRLHLEDDAPDAPPETSFAQAIGPEGYRQELRVRNPQAIDEAVLRRLFCHAFLCATAAERAGAVATTPVPPEWLVEGLAQAVDPQVRTQGPTEWVQAWRNAAAPTVGALLASPPGRSNADARFLAAWVLWLAQHARAEKSSALLRLLGAVGRGETVDVPWIQKANGFDSPAALEVAWDDYLMGLRNVRIPSREVTLDDLLTLRASLLSRPGADGIPDDPALPRLLEPRALLPLRRARWVRDHAMSKAVHLEHMGVARPAAYLTVTEAYTAFYRALYAGRSARRLGQSLAAAEAAMRDLETWLGRQPPVATP